MNVSDKSLSKIFGILSNPIRLKIYSLILKGACEPDLHSKNATNCATKIAKRLKLNQPTVSNHIKELVNVNLVIIRKSGKHSYLYGVKKTSRIIFEFGSQVKNEISLSSNSA